jgi:hypothetical protein
MKMPRVIGVIISASIQSELENSPSIDLRALGAARRWQGSLRCSAQHSSRAGAVLWGWASVCSARQISRPSSLRSGQITPHWAVVDLDALSVGHGQL